jgi:single-stranded DNA-binding protein
MLIWGKVTRDAKLEYTKGSNNKPPMPKVTFGVAYEEKKFMNVLALGESPQTNIAQRVRKGDQVLIAGRWSSKEYKNSAGEEKTWAELRIEQIVIQSDDYREEMIDCLWTAFANAMAKGYMHDRTEFMRAFNTGFVDAFWELCQSMQGEEPQETDDGEAAGGDDYELTI